jgi:hypothetical protein
MDHFRPPASAPRAASSTAITTSGAPARRRQAVVVAGGKRSRCVVVRIEQQGRTDEKLDQAIEDTRSDAEEMQERSEKPGDRIEAAGSAGTPSSRTTRAPARGRRWTTTRSTRPTSPTSGGDHGCRAPGRRLTTLPKRNAKAATQAVLSVPVIAQSRTAPRVDPSAPDVLAGVVVRYVPVAPRSHSRLSFLPEDELVHRGVAGTAASTCRSRPETGDA